MQWQIGMQVFVSVTWARFISLYVCPAVIRMLGHPSFNAPDTFAPHHRPAYARPSLRSHTPTFSDLHRQHGPLHPVRWSHLMKSTDGRKTWNYFSTAGPGGEPAVVRLSRTEMTAVIRGDRDSCMKQTFSHDGGKTWSEPVKLEVGKVLPDL